MTNSSSWPIAGGSNPSQSVPSSNSNEGVTCNPQNSSISGALLLFFDLLTRPKMPFKVMHRKEVTHSKGSYERKSRGRKLVDEMGRGKKNSHGTLIDWCTGREWPLNCMTVVSAWWRLNIRFQRSNGHWMII